MQTVKIGDVEYPWPEGCRMFFTHGNGFYFSPHPWHQEPDSWSHDESFPYEIGNDRLSENVIPMIASVAAMHFENKAAVLEPKCRVPDKHMDMKTGVMTVENAEEIQSFWAYRQAAAQWRTLCKEI